MAAEEQDHPHPTLQHKFQLGCRQGDPLLGGERAGRRSEVTRDLAAGKV